MYVVPGEGMSQSVAPTGLYTIAILAPTTPVVGYGVPSLTGLERNTQAQVGRAPEGRGQPSKAEGRPTHMFNSKIQFAGEVVPPT